MFVIFTKFTTLFSGNILHLIKIKIIIILFLSKHWFFTSGFRKAYISSRRKHFGDNSRRHRLYFQQKKEELLAEEKGVIRRSDTQSLPASELF